MGARNDHPILLDHFTRFYKEQFFPTIKARGIDTVWHLGDLVDRRKFINYRTLQVLKNSLLEPLRDACGHVNILMGNHDQYFKNIVSPNALEELLGEYNFNVYCRPTIVDNITVLPWICEETQEEAHKLMQESRTRFCFGHLQIKSFEMDRGHFAIEGEEMEGFSKFDLVLTGHFHHKSSYNNIHYLGAPYEMTWRDFDDPKGFHIFDTETGELEYVPNKQHLFRKYFYDDETTNIQTHLSRIDEDIQDAFVKVVVKNRFNSFWFDTFIDKINEKGVSDIQIVDDHYNLNIEADNDILSQADDTLTILNKCVDSITDATCNTHSLKAILKELYDEAQSLT